MLIYVWHGDDDHYKSVSSSLCEANLAGLERNNSKCPIHVSVDQPQVPQVTRTYSY